MKTLTSLLGAPVLIVACAGARAAAPTATPASILPTLAPPRATTPAPTEPASPGGVGDIQ